MVHSVAEGTNFEPLWHYERVGVVTTGTFLERSIFQPANILQYKTKLH